MCDGGTEMAKLCVRGIQLVTSEAPLAMFAGLFPLLLAFSTNFGFRVGYHIVEAFLVWLN